MVLPRTVNVGEERTSSRVLLVEDDLDFAESLSEILTAEGYEVKAVGGRDEALSVAPDFAPQVAFVDIRLGQESGISLIPELKRALPRLVCIAMTAYARLDSAIEAVQQGVYDYLQKPLDVASLLMILKRAVEKHELENCLHLVQKIEAVGRLTGGVAHDFNNIMTVVLGHVDVLHEEVSADCCSREELLKGLEEIRDAALHADVLTQRLLLFGRHHIASPVPLDLNKVLAGMETVLSRLIRENIKIVINTETDLPLVPADPVQVEQVILNLAINSCDAMEEGGELTIETESRPADANDRSSVIPRDSVILRVRDTGDGMAPHTIKRACEPFFTTKEPGKGTGLGLWTIKGIAAESGGDVVISSDPGEGTTVEVFFPENTGTEPEESTKVALCEVPGGTETLLLCEDDEKVMLVTRSLLAGRGYTVLAAGSSREALDLVSTCQGQIDLVVTDVVMPEMSGPELIREIRSRCGDTRVLFISGYQPDSVDWLDSFDQEASFLQKPFDKGTLLSRVRELLDASG